jgi:phospholipid/cholesterol/gamma-HCH transport system substrate-binding protein
VSRTAAERNTEFERLLAEGNVLRQEVRARRDSVHSLLVGTQNLSRQLSGLVTDNQAQLVPALEHLDRVTGLLQRNQDNLDHSIRLYGPYMRLLSNLTGNGQWADVSLCGLLPPSVGPFNSEGCRP